MCNKTIMEKNKGSRQIVLLRVVQEDLTYTKAYRIQRVVLWGKTKEAMK